MKLNAQKNHRSQNYKISSRTSAFEALITPETLLNATNVTSVLNKLPNQFLQQRYVTDFRGCQFFEVRL